MKIASCPIDKDQMKCVQLCILSFGPCLFRLCCWPLRGNFLIHGNTKTSSGRGIRFGFLACGCWVLHPFWSLLLGCTWSNARSNGQPNQPKILGNSRICQQICPSRPRATLRSDMPRACVRDLINSDCVRGLRVRPRATEVSMRVAYRFQFCHLNCV